MIRRARSVKSQWKILVIDAKLGVINGCDTVKLGMKKPPESQKTQGFSGGGNFLGLLFL